MQPDAPTLSISCVVYDTDFKTLQQTIQSLYVALNYAQEHKCLGQYTFYLINNYPIIENTFADIILFAKSLFVDMVVLQGHGNIGYGKGNNLAINDSKLQYHLILNPDVFIKKNAIHVGLNFLEANSHVALVAPHAVNDNGLIEYLAKREPNALIILLRGLNNVLLNRYFKKTLDHYTYKDILPATQPIKIELASGCFMLCRAVPLHKVGGFSPEYFLYFEDFDLSRKLRRHHFCICLLPKMQIIHAGGNAARKGFLHIKMFIKSYWLYKKNCS